MIIASSVGDRIETIATLHLQFADGSYTKGRVGDYWISFHNYIHCIIHVQELTEGWEKLHILFIHGCRIFPKLQIVCYSVASFNLKDFERSLWIWRIMIEFFHLLQAKDAVGNALENVKNVVTPEKKWGWWCSSRRSSSFNLKELGDYEFILLCNSWRILKN